MSESATRKQLLDAAQSLVQRVGANAMSYQDLSEAVGIRKASIHHHFPTKSDLLVALIARYSEEFLTLLRSICAARASGLAKLTRYVRLFEATVRESGAERACPCGMLGAEIATLSPPAAATLRVFYSENAAVLAAILAEGRADGTLAFPGRPEDVAWLLFSMLEGAMLVSRVDGGTERFGGIVAQFSRMVKA